MTHHTGSDEGLSEADQASVEWALAYARGYWRYGNEPVTQDALTIFSRAILAARDAAPDALRERVEDELDAIWRESQGDRTIIQDAGIMQDIVRRLRAALAEQ